MSKQTRKLNPPEDPGGSSMQDDDDMYVPGTKETELSPNRVIPETYPLPESQSYSFIPETLLPLESQLDISLPIAPESHPLPESPKANSFAGFTNTNDKTLDSHSEQENDTQETIIRRRTNQRQRNTVVHLDTASAGPSTNLLHRKFPTNSTLRSSGQENTIVFRQVPSPDVNNHGNILTLDPVGIALSFNKQLPQEEIKDIRINRRRNVVAVEVKSPTPELMDKLKNISKIGKCTVKGHKPSEEVLGTHCSGVISPIGLDADLNELGSMMTSPAKILKLSRLPKFSNGRKEDSVAIKIDFEGSEIPERIKLGFVSFLVKEYNPPPIRCFRCQRIGHMAGGCTANPRCQICSGNHPRSECRNRDTPKCANCGLSHVASSRECIFTIKAVEITKLMRQGNSFTQAKNMVDRTIAPPDIGVKAQRNPNRKSQNNLDTDIQQTLNPTLSYRDILRHNQDTTQQNENSQQQQNQEDSISATPYPPSNQEEHTQPSRQTQCHCTYSQKNRLQPNVQPPPNLKEVIKECLSEFCENLIGFIREIFSSSILGGTHEQENIIVHAARKHLDNKVKETIENQIGESTRITRGNKKKAEINNNQPDLNSMQISSDSDSQTEIVTEEDVLSSDVEVKTNNGRTKRKKKGTTPGKKAKSNRAHKNKKRK